MASAERPAATSLRCVFVPFDWNGKEPPQAIEHDADERIVSVYEVGGQGPAMLRVWLASSRFYNGLDSEVAKQDVSQTGNFSRDVE